jgi:hypothetical protein
VHKLLGIKPIERFIHMTESEWIAFSLLNILDHMFIFAILLENLFKIFCK